MKNLLLLSFLLALTAGSLRAHDGGHGKKDPHCAGKGTCCAATKAAATTKSAAPVRPAKPQTIGRRATR